MMHRFASLGLAPVFLAQGLWVRFRTPRLPEPPGPRHGVDGSGPPLNLLILGDSAAAGVGAATQSEALSGQLVSALAPHVRVSWKLVASSGFTTREALKQLETAERDQFEIAVTSLGVNDVTHGTKPNEWLALQGQLVDLLESKFQARHVLLSSVPPMHEFPALPQPLRWYLGTRATLLNEMLRDYSERDERCEFIPPSFQFRAEHMASDGFHPSATAYSVWAAGLADSIQQWLARNR